MVVKDLYEMEMVSKKDLHGLRLEQNVLWWWRRCEVYMLKTNFKVISNLCKHSRSIFIKIN